MGKIILLIWSLAFYFCAHAQLTGDLREEIENLVSKYHTKHSFHGNVLVSDDDGVLYERSIGFSQAEWGVSHTRDSKFMIASLSKSFTAAKILLMEHQNLLSLDDLVSDFISLPKNSEIDRDLWQSLKVRHLLNHTGGLKRDFSSVDGGHRSTYRFLGETVYHALNQKVFLSRPGERFQYSNLGYLLLAKVIESAGSRFYEDELKNSLLRPLKMYNTGEYHRLKFIEHMSDGYLLGERGRVSKRCCDDATSLRGAASLYSTVYDLDTWLKALTSSLEHFGFDLFSKLLSNEVDTGFNDQAYFNGFMKEQTLGFERVFHTGHEWGYQSSMSLYPGLKNLRVVILSNRHEFLGFSEVHRVDELSKEVVELILGGNQEL